MSIGLPNFFIEKFRIPPFLLPIYQAAGSQYGVPWEVLAAINEIETDYGRNVGVSSAGAVGWMQFLSSTWELYGVDASGDGVKDPDNPVDAIFAAARYLRSAGAHQDLRNAIFAYNHADWYVESVLRRARVISGLPAGLVGSLTGLARGRFPVDARATYASRMSNRDVRGGNTGASVLASTGRRRAILIYASPGAPVVAVNEGRVVRVGRSKRLGRFVQLQDVYGNTYTYARLKSVAEVHPSGKPRKVSPVERPRERELTEPRDSAKPTAPASTATRASLNARGTAAAEDAPESAKQRLFANPRRPRARRAGGKQQIFERTGAIEGRTSVKDHLDRLFGHDRNDIEIKTLRPGARVAAGTILGRIGHTQSRRAPHMLFEIRPAGRGAPRIDPRPILDGWRLLGSIGIYGAASKSPSLGQVLLMSKEALAARVLSDGRIHVYGCGRQDIRAGEIDRRVLATLEFLSASGLDPTVSSLKCGHSLMTTSGNVSEHSTGSAVDIAAINGVPIAGHQGKGSIAELAVRRLLTLQGTMRPHQIISLMQFQGADNAFAMADHADHIHVGWRPLVGAHSEVEAVLRPAQWTKLIDRLGEMQSPKVRLRRSKRASRPHAPR